MGNSDGKVITKQAQLIEPSSKVEKEATKLLEKAAHLETLKADWLDVQKIPFSVDSSGRVVTSADFGQTAINPTQFKMLMTKTVDTKEIDTLFTLYDCNHDGLITWREYICVIAIIMKGSEREKLTLIFNCFDSDGNGTLSKEEFLSVAKKLSKQDETALVAFTEKVFTACDKDKNGSVSFKEFESWVSLNHKDFDELSGVLNIFPSQADQHKH